MALPLKYSLRNVIVRWRSSIATLISVGLVIGVWIVMQAMAVGLEKASGETGDPRNLLVIRRGADSESTSQITRENLAALQYSEEVAQDANGRPLLSADSLVIIYLPRGEGAEGGANVTFRGVSPNGAALRPQVKLMQGRWFEPGKREVTISQRLAGRFANMQIGGTIRIGVRELKVVGHFDAGGSAYDSEAWLDADDARALFTRENYASVLLRPVDEAAGQRLKERLEADKRLLIRVVPEVAYYAEQTKSAVPFRFAGAFLATIMSIGALLAAMNTMYASVAARTREIGTLRVLGFRRRSIVLAVLIEGGCIAGLGGLLGCGAAAWIYNGHKTGTFNFQTFSESVFQLTITTQLVLEACILAVVLGIIGALLPAIRASRMPVIAALKSL